MFAQPQTPTKLVEDITEIIKKENGTMHAEMSYQSPSDFSVSHFGQFYRDSWPFH